LALGIPERAPTCLYAGNLDQYQGWEALLTAIVRLRDTLPDARLLLATESDPGPVLREAAGHGVGEALLIRRLSGEQARAMAHAAADVACIPRRSEGGLPIKMLDAFSRSTPVVATRRATAGLPIHDVCEIVPDDDPQAFAGAVVRLLAPGAHAEALRERAHRYLASEHSPKAYRDALDRLLDTGPVNFRKATPSALRPQAAQAPRAR
jgi:glycosyltransferase involved in cell wall biosynthesis